MNQDQERPEDACEMWKIAGQRILRSRLNGCLSLPSRARHDWIWQSSSGWRVRRPRNPIVHRCDIDTARCRDTSRYSRTRPRRRPYAAMAGSWICGALVGTVCMSWFEGSSAPTVDRNQPTFQVAEDPPRVVITDRNATPTSAERSARRERVSAHPATDIRYCRTQTHGVRDAAGPKSTHRVRNERRGRDSASSHASGGSG